MNTVSSYKYVQLSEESLNMAKNHYLSAKYTPLLFSKKSEDIVRHYVDNAGIFICPLIWYSMDVCIVDFLTVRIVEGKEQLFFKFCELTPRDEDWKIANKGGCIRIVADSDADSNACDSHEVMLFLNSNPPFKYRSSDKLTKGLRKALRNIQEFCEKIDKEIQNGKLADILSNEKYLFSQAGTPIV